MEQKKKGISRRDFSRGLAAIATAASFPASATAKKINSAESAPAQSDAALPVDAEAQYRVILSKYGNRLSEDEKKDVQRLVATAQKTGESMRSFELHNWNEPATIYLPDFPQEDR